MSNLYTVLARLLVLDEIGEAEGHEWEELVLTVKEAEGRDPDLDMHLPHSFWHFVADADIRRGDPQYAKEQRANLRRWLDQVVRNP